MKILGVDLGSYSVKIAELDVSAKGYSLTNFLEYPLSLDPQKDRNLEVIEILRRVSSQVDGKNTKWIVGVQQQRVSVHQKTFPFKERPKILKSLAFELEDEIPLDIDETIFDVKINETQGPLADVLTVASPKEAIQELLDLCKDGGFDPEIVSVEGLALANLFQPWDAAPPEKLPKPAYTEGTMVLESGARARVVLQMGHQRSTLLVFRGDILISVRSILWGGNDIANAISQALSVPIFEAVKIMHSKGAILMNSAGAAKDQILLSRTIATSLDMLMRDLRLSLLDVRAAHNLEFERMELTGGVSQVQNIGAYITQALEIPVNVAHTMQTVRSRIEQGSKMDATAALAVGLAIEGLKRPRNPAVNLRRADFARENESLKRFWETWKVPVQVATTAFLLFFVYVFIRDSFASSLVIAADDRVTELAQKVAGLKGASATEDGVIRYIAKQRKLVKDREALKDTESINSALDVMTRLAEKLPVMIPAKPGQGLDIHRLNIDGSDLIIEGRIQGGGGVAAVQRALSEFAVPKSVQATAPSGLPQGVGTPFGFRAKVVRTQ